MTKYLKAVLLVAVMLIASFAVAQVVTSAWLGLMESFCHVGGCQGCKAN